VLEEVVTGFCQDFGEQETRLNQLECHRDKKESTMPTNGSSNNIPGRPSHAHAAWLGAVGPRIAAGYAAMPLPIVVEAVLAELTSADQSFTAYDVTMILRALFPYPQRELPHYDQHDAPGVQPEVHRQMADYLAAGAYTVDVAYSNGMDPARLYTPNQRGRRAGRWFSLSAVFGAGHGSTPLPVGAWVIKDGRKSMGDGRWAEVGSRRSEVGGRKSEVGSRRSEVGGRKSEVGSRRSEVGGRK